MKEGWRYEKLDDLGTIVTGATPSTNDESNYFPKEYLNKVLTNISYQIRLLALARSKGATREALPKSVVDSLLVPLPPLPLQYSFAQKIEQIERQKAAIQKTITDLETLLAARMQYWFD